MITNILFIGDVVGKVGSNYLSKKLPSLKKNFEADVTIVNGENSADGNGITKESAGILFASGADIITTGNHVFRQRSVYDYLGTEPYLIRPANYHADNPGKGYCIYDMGKYSLAVINMLGVALMEPLRNPFDTIDEILAKITTKNIILDFHAETTSEKIAMINYLDGRVSAVIGTHTHVQTADAAVFPKGSAYISDAGMTGPIHSVLGIRPEIAISKFKYGMPLKFETAQGDCILCGAVITINEQTGKALKIESFKTEK